ncbi:MAG: hypothetical protein HUK08_00420 [Bacteroidaceae bacterium]|nr:hypothetical protein [Bacteroidaceae bacterium]
MANNTFKSQRKHTRVKFQPLTVSCTLVCLTPQSPCTQTVNANIVPPEYEPNRAETPTVILPDVRANDPDNIFHAGSANEFLAVDNTLQWFVDGEKLPIAGKWVKGTDYDIITTSDDTRGAIKIYKNIAANEKAILTFKGVFNDWRTGINYNVESDEIALFTTDKGANQQSCTVDKPIIVYDPLYDDLLLYDYKKANNIPVTGQRSDYINGKCFEQSVTVNFTDGETALATLPSGTTMRLCVLGTTTPITPNSEAHPEVMAAAYPTVKFDMRQIARADYEVQFVTDSKIICRAAIGLETTVTMPMNGQPMNNADIPVSTQQYFNYALLNLADRQVDYPELYYLLTWFTQAQVNDGGVWRYAEVKRWQDGTDMSAPIEGLGIGITRNDSFFDIWFDLTPHDRDTLLLDENGVALCDEDNNLLIG